MDKLNRKILTLMVVVLTLVLMANSYILYRSINRYLHNEMRRENTELASEIATLLTDEPGLITVRFIKKFFDITGVQGFVNTLDKGIIYSNLSGLTPKEILLRPDIIGARSEIINPSGDLIGQVIIVERDTSASRIQTIFFITLAITTFFGIFLVLALSFMLYKTVSKPLKHIMADMAHDRIIDLDDKAWAPLVSTHNQAKESRTRFFRQASHAMKTPLMNIQGSLEAFEDEIFSQEEMSHKISYEVAKLKESVDQMIRASKAETYAPDKATWQALDLKTFFKTSLPLLPTHISLDFHLDPEPFYFDANTLQIIFDNLVQNAIRYAKTKITIQYTHQNNKVVFLISDDGDGVDAQLSDKLFEPFAKGISGKTGLGLSIVKSYVNTSGGQIYYAYDKGAVFRIEWPL